MTKPLQGETFYEFRNHIMGMTNGDNIANVQKVKDEIAQNEDFLNGLTDR